MMDRSLRLMEKTFPSRALKRARSTLLDGWIRSTDRPDLMTAP